MKTAAKKAASQITHKSIHSTLMRKHIIRLELAVKSFKCFWLFYSEILHLYFTVCYKSADLLYAKYLIQHISRYLIFSNRLPLYIKGHDK